MLEALSLKSPPVVPGARTVRAAIPDATPVNTLSTQPDNDATWQPYVGRAVSHEAGRGTLYGATAGLACNLLAGTTLQSILIGGVGGLAVGIVIGVAMGLRAWQRAAQAPAPAPEPPPAPVPVDPFPSCLHDSKHAADLLEARLSAIRAFADAEESYSSFKANVSVLGAARESLKTFSEAWRSFAGGNRDAEVVDASRVADRKGAVENIQDQQARLLEIAAGAQSVRARGEGMYSRFVQWTESIENGRALEKDAKGELARLNLRTQTLLGT